MLVDADPIHLLHVPCSEALGRKYIEPGVPAGLAEHTVTLRYNDVEGVRAAFAEIGDQVACVIVEPIAGNMNMVPPVPGFLETLREECTRAGALLILDDAQWLDSASWTLALLVVVRAGILLPVQFAPEEVP